MGLPLNKTTKASAMETAKKNTDIAGMAALVVPKTANTPRYITNIQKMFSPAIPNGMPARLPVTYSNRT